MLEQFTKKMTIDEAIKDLEKIKKVKFSPISQPVSMDMAIEALKATRWIPVTERLPEPKQKVLVATYLGGVYYGFMEPRGKFYTANNTLADSWCWEPDVTHWMPLPQPPKEETE